MQKNSYLYSRLVFLQSNAEHIPVYRGKRKKENKEAEIGGRQKGLSYFLCHLMASISTAIPLHHVKNSKQVNNIVSEAKEKNTERE